MKRKDSNCNYRPNAHAVAVIETEEGPLIHLKATTRRENVLWTKPSSLDAWLEKTKTEDAHIVYKRSLP